MFKGIPIAGCALLLLGAPASPQPTQLDVTNPHYFFHGQPTVLITSADHYGAVTNLDSNYIAYLDGTKGE